MLDTFEIALEAGYSTVKLLEEALEVDIKFTNNFYRLINPLEQPGMRAINITKQQNSQKYRIAFEMNPRELLIEEESIDLFLCNKENVEVLYRKLDEELTYIHRYFSLTNGKWCLSRIDYAMQFRTPNVELYTTLESKGPFRYHYEGLQKPGSTYNKCKSSTINAYNKDDQLSKTNSSAQLKTAAKNLYRFECQCLKTNYLRKKFDIYYNDLFGLFREDIALSVLKAQHQRHIKTGDYYSYDEAEKKIKEMKGKQQRTKKKVLEVLRFIEAAGSLPIALQAIRNDADSVPEQFRGANSERSYEILKDKFNELIREQLCKEGINPILLPNDCGLTTLPNTYAELFTA